MMTHTQRHQTLNGLAVALASSLRDKFDFSDDSQFQAWADLSFKAAGAFLAKTEPMLDAAVAKDVAANEAALAKHQKDTGFTPEPKVPLTEVKP